MLKIYLPTPPSANSLFRTTNGKRYKTKAYKAWLSEGLVAIKQQKITHTDLTGVRITLFVPRLSLASDIDNRIKPTLDLLVKAKVLKDDRYVDSVCATWLDKNEQCYVMIDGTYDNR